MKVISHWLHTMFLRALIATARGRAHLLNLVVAAEEGDEAGVFDALIANHLELAKIVRRHQQDEQRHARMFRACVARTGITPARVPDELRVVQCVARALAREPAPDAKPCATDDIVNTYALLLAIEQRGVRHFRVMADEFRRIGDRETAATFDQVVRDEQRHVRYCQAIGRRYAGDDARWQRAVQRFAAVERRGFREAFTAGALHAFRHRLLGFSGAHAAN